MTETDTPVIIDFKNLAAGSLDPVIITVVTLPPPLAAQRTLTKTIIGPVFQYLGDNIFLLIKTKGDRRLHFAAYGNLNLPTKKLRNHAFMVNPRLRAVNEDFLSFPRKRESSGEEWCLDSLVKPENDRMEKTLVE